MRWPNLLNPRTVLGAVKVRPGNVGARREVTRRPTLTAPARGAFDDAQAGAKERLSARTKELSKNKERAMT
jgi:hypothetical protein